MAENCPFVDTLFLCRMVSLKTDSCPSNLWSPDNLATYMARPPVYQPTASCPSCSLRSCILLCRQVCATYQPICISGWLVELPACRGGAGQAPRLCSMQCSITNMQEPTAQGSALPPQSCRTNLRLPASYRLMKPAPCYLGGG